MVDTRERSRCWRYVPPPNVAIAETDWLKAGRCCEGVPTFDGVGSGLRVRLFDPIGVRRPVEVSLSALEPVSRDEYERERSLPPTAHQQSPPTPDTLEQSASNDAVTVT